MSQGTAERMVPERRVEGHPPRPDDRRGRTGAEASHLADRSTRGSRRKPREPRPPARYVRSHTGVCAELVRTRVTRRGCWLYRLRYAEILGSQRWTLGELLSIDGLRWLRRRPAALRKAGR